jgi:hypothetical protein
MDSRSRAPRLVLASLLSLLLASSTTNAQTYRGTLLGTIYDGTGAVVPGATVTATNAATGVARTTVSDPEGNYVLTELPVGQYGVSVQKEGFTTGLVKSVDVGVSGEQRVDVTLQSGQVSEQVEVVAEVPIVQTTTNVLGGTISNAQIQELPINGRDYQKVLYLVPGSLGDPAGGADSPGSFGLFSSNGSRGRSNNYLLDGTESCPWR